MAVLPDPPAEQPAPPRTPGDRPLEGERAPSERDREPAPAESSVTGPTRTYAPHSQRVPKDPQPGHEELVAGGAGGEGVDTPPGVPTPGADRSAPEEIIPETLPRA